MLGKSAKSIKGAIATQPSRERDSLGVSFGKNVSMGCVKTFGIIIFRWTERGRRDESI